MSVHDIEVELVNARILGGFYGIGEVSEVGGEKGCGDFCHCRLVGLAFDPILISHSPLALIPLTLTLSHGGERGLLVVVQGPYKGEGMEALRGETLDMAPHVPRIPPDPLSPMRKGEYPLAGAKVPIRGRGCGGEEFAWIEGMGGWGCSLPCSPSP